MLFTFRNSVNLSEEHFQDASLEAMQRIASCALLQHGALLHCGPIQLVDGVTGIEFITIYDEDNNLIVDFVNEGTYERRMTSDQADGVV